MREQSRFEIERNGVRITAVKNDPDGLPTYDRVFLYRYDSNARADTPARRTRDQ